MKFFTPKRYLRLGNLDNEAKWRAAQQEWENAIARYEEHFREIRDLIPAKLRRLMESVYLHDARVLDIWQGPASRFTITLQPESDRDHLVVLSYSLIQTPSVKRGILPPEACSEPVGWLYDELDIVEPESNGRKRKGKVPSKGFVHNILLSNGWEIRLVFRDVTVVRPVPLIPSLPERSVERTAAS